jgi:hypothetical protein
VLDLLDKFLAYYLLHWIEVCSLLGDLRNALLSVANMHRILLVCYQLHSIGKTGNLRGNIEGWNSIKEGNEPPQ